MESREKSFFNQAAMKGYETEIVALKKEIEQLQETAIVRNKFSFFKILTFRYFSMKSNWLPVFSTMKKIV